MSVFDTNSFAVYATWQSSAWLAAGLLAAALLARAPARAHVALVVAILAALATPLLSAVGRAMGLGLLAGSPELLSASSGPSPDMTAAGAAALSWLTLGRALGVVWCLLTIAAAVRLATGIRAARMIALEARPLADESAARIAHGIAAELGIAVDPELSSSTAVTSPVVWSWGGHPRIFLPQRSLSREHLAPILCHELAHFARKDHLASLAGELLVCAFPWNPLAWIARRRLAAESERACDRYVIATGEEPARYVEALLSLCTGRRAAVTSLAPSAVGARRALARRLRGILDLQRDTRHRAGRTFRLAGTAIALAASTGIALAHPRTQLLEPIEHVYASLPAELWEQCEAATPGLCVLPGELDLGEVEPGGTAAGSLWIANTDELPHEIVEAKPTCGCLALIDLAGRMLAPGEVVELPLTMQAPNGRGQEKVQKVIVLTEDLIPIEVEVRVSTSPAASG